MRIIKVYAYKKHARLTRYEITYCYGEILGEIPYDKVEDTEYVVKKIDWVPKQIEIDKYINLKRVILWDDIQ